METRANHALIGLFTLAVIAAAFGFVYWFNLANKSGERQHYRVVFQGSVSGLSRGSVVRFNGLTVGEVQAIALVPDDPRIVAATIAVAPQTPIKADTRARLEYQGLTGVAAVQLSGGSPTAPTLTTPDGQGMATLFADRSDFQDILETVQRLAGKVDEVITKVEKVIDDGQGPLTRSLLNAETFSKALSDNAPAVSSFLATAGDIGTQFASVSAKIDRLASDADDIVRAVDPKSIGRFVGNADAFAQTLADNRQNVTGILADTASLTKRLNESSTKLDAALADVARVTQAIDAQKIAGIVSSVENVSGVLSANSRQIDSALKSADTGLKSLDAFAKTLSDNRDVVSDILTNTASLSKTLSDSAPKVDTALTELNRVAQALDSQRIATAVSNIETASDNIARVSATVAGDNDQIDATLKNAADISAKLNQASDRVDRVLAAAENFLGTNQQGAKSAIYEFGEASKAVRATAVALDKRFLEISAGVTKFAGSGSKELTAVSADARTSLDSLNRTVRSIERNPQQFLFGAKSNLPDYNGRR